VCDFPEEELAEYLLWKAASEERAVAKPGVGPARELLTLLTLTTDEPAAALAQG
jgi:hypothetical protein